jgi:hypothetical protein
MRGQPVITKGDLTANGRRLGPFGITEAGTEAKTTAILQLDQQGTQHACVFALARQVSHYNGFGILVPFQLA